ncbi:hypothetical protein [Streptomyces sp. NPDC089915]|uniref:hypothetical protein n=1 Tax=Streptomyces sp. NPDC089915 TaxID=3155186 RepID=UPI00343D1DD3
MDSHGEGPDGVRELAGIRRAYAARGYELVLPGEVAARGGAERRRIAGQVVSLLVEVYRRAPGPDDERAARELDGAVAEGGVRLFVLLDRRRDVVATTRFTRLARWFTEGPREGPQEGPREEGDAEGAGRGDVRYEVGRTGKRPGAEPRLAAGLLRARLLWAAAGGLPGAGLLVSHTRVARSAPGRPPVGPVLEGLVRDGGFLPAHAVRSHVVARTAVEPFVAACAPRDGAAWAAGVRAQRLRLPDRAEARLFAAMLAEGWGARPVLVPVADGGAAGPAFRAPLPGALRELSGPDPAVESLYLLSRRPADVGRAVDGIPYRVRADGAYASAGLSDRVVVEADAAEAPDAVAVLERLRRAGFALAGWEPSRQRSGRLALVLTRPGRVPDGGTAVAAPDLSALDRLPAAQRFLGGVLARLPEQPDGRI